MFQQNTSTVATAVHGSTVPCLILQHLFSLPTPALHSLLIRSESQNLCHVLPRKSCSQAPKHRPRDTCAATCAWHSLSLSLSLNVCCSVSLAHSLTLASTSATGFLLLEQTEAVRHTDILSFTLLLLLSSAHVYFGRLRHTHRAPMALGSQTSLTLASLLHQERETRRVSHRRKEGERERDQCQRRT